MWAAGPDACSESRENAGRPQTWSEWTRLPGCAVAREKTPQATFYETPANAIPLPDASVAVAFATLSFHHWADKPRGLREISRVLRPGGAFINADLLWPNWIRWLVNDWHPSAPAPAILQTMLRLAGLPEQDRFRMTYGFVFVTHSIKTIPA